MSRVTFADACAGSSDAGSSQILRRRSRTSVVAQVFKVDAKGLAVRELGVVLSLSGKIGVDLDAMADIADEDEGRPAMRRRQRAGVFFRLALGVEHQHVPGAIGAASAARVFRDVGGEQVVLTGDLLAALQAALLGLENKAVLLVEVDPPVRVAFVPVLPDGAFEDIVVVFVGGVGRIGRRQSQQTRSIR